MEGKKDGGYRAHVVVIPYPSQGHINPMLQFAKRLASKGLKATLATTHYTLKSIHAPGVSIEPISDGFDDAGFSQADNVKAYLEKFKDSGSRTLAELIRKLGELGSPVDCIIYDSFLTWAVGVAQKFGIYAASFFTHSASTCALICRAYHGLLCLPLNPDGLPLTFQGLPPLEFSDLVSYLTRVEAYPAYWEMVLGQFDNLEKVEWVFVNSFNALEGQAVKPISDQWPVKMVGPMVPSAYLDGRIKDDRSYGANLWTPLYRECKQWLDAKPKGSVVFVSFGSMSHISPDQMAEVAWGLKGCEKPFIWVVKESERSKLPHDFEPSIKDQGLVVTWCDQLEVLSHQAVSCFVTHCGWNSTLEGLSVGVPLIALPQWADQPLNGKLLEDVWRVGLRARIDEKGIVRREEMEFCVREIVEGERGEELRRNGLKWSELAKQAVDEGGDSDKNIEEFVGKLLGCRNGRSMSGWEWAKTLGVI